jgi:ribose 5-phosphate isomerase B
MTRIEEIAIASDHAGLDLKNHLVKFLLKQGYNVIDMGVRKRVRCDYPVYAKKVAQAVAAGDVPAGILLCGTGIGMSMVANRYPGVRAAVVHDHFTAQAAKAHNNANVLCIGARVTANALAEELVSTWLETKFEGGRHQDRLDQIDG